MNNIVNEILINGEKKDESVLYKNKLCHIWKE